MVSKPVPIHAIVLSQKDAMQYMCLQVIDILHDGIHRDTVTYNHIAIVSASLCSWLEQFIGAEKAATIHSGILGIAEALIREIKAEGRNPGTIILSHINEGQPPAAVVSYHDAAIKRAITYGPSYSAAVISADYKERPITPNEMAVSYFRSGDVKPAATAERAINDGCRGIAINGVITLSTIYDNGTREEQCKDRKFISGGVEEVDIRVATNAVSARMASGGKLFLQFECQPPERYKHYVYEPDITSTGIYYVHKSQLIPIAYRGYELSKNKAGFRAVFQKSPVMSVARYKCPSRTEIYDMMQIWIKHINVKLGDPVSYTMMADYRFTATLLYQDMMAKHWGDLGLITDALIHNYRLMTSDNIESCISNLLGVTVGNCDGVHDHTACGKKCVVTVNDFKPMSIINIADIKDANAVSEISRVEGSQ